MLADAVGAEVGVVARALEPDAVRRRSDGAPEVRAGGCERDDGVTASRDPDAPELDTQRAPVPAPGGRATT